MAEQRQYLLRRDGLAAQQLDDEVVVLDLQTSAYLLLNATGAALWPLLTQGATLDQLAAQLVADFDIEHDVAAADAEVFVKELDRLSLLATH